MDSYFDHTGVDLHREDGPARIVMRSDGSLESHEWFRHGKRHRVDGPARTEFSTSTGVPTKEEWCLGGQEARVDDGPTLVTYYDSGRIASETFTMTDGNPHRVGGPAVVRYAETGEMTEELYYRGGELHRIDGPCLIDRGKGYIRTGYGFGNRYGRSFSDAIRSCPVDEFREEIASSSFAPLLDEGGDAETIRNAIADGVRTIDGLREVLGGAPAEWVRSYEGAAS